MKGRNGMPRLFALCVAVAYCKPQCSSRNEDLQCATVSGHYKKCDRKNNRRAGVGSTSFHQCKFRKKISRAPQHFTLNDGLGFLLHGGNILMTLISFILYGNNSFVELMNLIQTLWKILLKFLMKDLKKLREC